MVPVGHNTLAEADPSFSLLAESQVRSRTERDRYLMHQILAILLRQTSECGPLFSSFCWASIQLNS